MRPNLEFEHTGNYSGTACTVNITTKSPGQAMLQGDIVSYVTFTKISLPPHSSL